MKQRKWRGAWLAGLCLFAAGMADGGDLSASRKSEIIRLLRQDCGSCHGMTLRGGLGPALLPENLRDKDREGLQNTVLYGRPGTPMSPWSAFLTEEDVAWLVQQLKEGVRDAQ